jgi:hypothetical protein
MWAASFTISAAQRFRDISWRARNRRHEYQQSQNALHFDRYNISNERDQREALRATETYRQQQAAQQQSIRIN